MCQMIPKVYPWNIKFLMGQAFQLQILQNPKQTAIISDAWCLISLNTLSICEYTEYTVNAFACPHMTKWFQGHNVDVRGVWCTCDCSCCSIEDETSKDTWGAHNHRFVIGAFSGPRGSSILSQARPKMHRNPSWQSKAV